MSADRWSNCPRCKQRRAEEVKAKDAQVAAAYGNVPIEQWDELRRESYDLMDAPLEATLREDYEFWGVSDGQVFHASYSAGCSVCGFTFLFEHEQDVEVGS